MAQLLGKVNWQVAPRPGFAVGRSSLPRSITPSKLQLQPELHDTRIHAHCADFSERARTRDVTRRIGKIGVIEEIEELPAQNHTDSIRESRALDEGHVDVALVRPSEDIPSQVSKDRPATDDWKLSSDQTSIGNEWRGNKYARIEELIDPAADATVPTRILQRGARRQLPRGQECCRAEERAGGTVKNTVREPGLERHDSGNFPPFD